MIWESAKGKKIAGANDNTIINNIQTYNGIFNSPKFIVIFRNPIDTAISAWHHNMKLAVEENDPEHELRMTRLGGIEEWVKNVAKGFAKDVQTYLNFSKEHNNIIMVRYEDLKDDKKANIIRLFDFLGASTSDQILNRVIEKSSLTAMKKTSVRKDFFRSGSTDMGKGIMSDDLRREIASIASEELLALNYDLTM